MRDKPTELPLTTTPFPALGGPTPNGNTFVLWMGTSLLDGETTIVVLASRVSNNDKTGDMIQTWILPADKLPTTMYSEGADTSICGNCVLRSKESGGLGACYVPKFRGPNGAWKAWHAGNAGTATPTLFAGRRTRIGAYGDPAAVPLWVWDAVVTYSEGWTGYTHQWREDWVQPYSKYLMASCDDPIQALEAQAMGWRTFTFHPEGIDYKPAGTILCPAERTGNSVKCIDCMQCSGLGAGRTVNVSITAHGTGSKAITWDHL